MFYILILSIGFWGIDAIQLNEKEGNSTEAFQKKGIEKKEKEKEKKKKTFVLFENVYTYKKWEK